MKCPNCNAESEGKYCPYCGTPLKADAPRKEEKKAEDVFEPKTLEDSINYYNQSVASAFKLIEDCKKSGLMKPEYSDILQQSFDVMNRSARLNGMLAPPAPKTEVAGDKNQKARAAIAKRVCPACGKRFKKRQTLCKSCGASLLPEDYEK